MLHFLAWIFGLFPCRLGIFRLRLFLFRSFQDVLSALGIFSFYPLTVVNEGGICHPHRSRWQPIWGVVRLLFIPNVCQPTWRLSYATIFPHFFSPSFHPFSKKMMLKYRTYSGVTTKIFSSLRGGSFCSNDVAIWKFLSRRLHSTARKVRKQKKKK